MRGQGSEETTSRQRRCIATGERKAGHRPADTYTRCWPDGQRTDMGEEHARSIASGSQGRTNRRFLLLALLLAAVSAVLVYALFARNSGGDGGGSGAAGSTQVVVAKRAIGQKVAIPADMLDIRASQATGRRRTLPGEGRVCRNKFTKYPLEANEQVIPPRSRLGDRNVGRGSCGDRPDGQARVLDSAQRSAHVPALIRPATWTWSGSAARQLAKMSPRRWRDGAPERARLLRSPSR